MREKLRFLGLDVHAETIAAAIAEPDGEMRSLGTIANREDSIRKFIKKLGSAEQLRACYEAGPTGFVVYWQLAQFGVECTVVAPTLVPKKPGDRVKTDRRDALKLARSHRNGDLTAVWVPDEASEALRDLVRHPRSGEAGAAGYAGPDPRAAGSTRGSAHLGSHDRRRTG
jgi:transposase